MRFLAMIIFARDSARNIVDSAKFARVKRRIYKHSGAISVEM
ncbi:hypothetical protein [Helicobacter sp. 23-1045]